MCCKTVACMEDCRGKLQELLGEILQDRKTGITVEKNAFNACIAKALERKIQRYWENADFRRLYTAKARCLLFNLQDPHNPTLLNKVREGLITPKTLANLTPQDMHPELWEEAMHNKMIRDVEQDPTETPEGIVTCKKCGSRRVQWNLKQTRASDEGSTIFCVCVQCKNRFRFCS